MLASLRRVGLVQYVWLITNKAMYEFATYKTASILGERIKILARYQRKTTNWQKRNDKPWTMAIDGEDYNVLQMTIMNNFGIIFHLSQITTKFFCLSCWKYLILRKQWLVNFFGEFPYKSTYRASFALSWMNSSFRVISQSGVILILSFHILMWTLKQLGSFFDQEISTRL